MDFFSLQEKARKKTKLLVFYFFLAVIFIITALNAATFFIVKYLTVPTEVTLSNWLHQPWSWIVTGVTLLMILLGSLIRLWQVSRGGEAIAEMVNARQVDPATSDLTERRLLNVVEEMSIASGMPTPSVYVMDHENAINAFVAGSEPSATTLVITRGALISLSRDELQGVIGHEFSHIFNGDMRINIRLIGILAGILILGQAGHYLLSIRHSTGYRSRKNSGNGVIVILAIGLSLFIIGYIGLFFGRLIKAGISRQREFLADASAVQFTRNPNGIAAALMKIRNHSTGAMLTHSHAEEMSHMCFGQAINFHFNSLFATHPPLEERIKALKPNYRPSRAQAREVKETLPDSAMGFNSSSINNIGTLEPKHKEYAAQLHQQLPTSLLAASHDRHKVQALVFALLLTEYQGITSEPLALIQQHYYDDFAHEVNFLYQELLNIGVTERMSILKLTRPAILLLDDDERQLLTTTLKLTIMADRKVSHFEYILYSLLNKYLNSIGDYDNKTYRHFKPVAKDIALVLDIFIKQGDQSTDAKQEVFDVMLKSFHIKPKPLSSSEFDAARLHQSITRLNRLSPLLKKQLLLTLADCILADKQVSQKEGELLRAISEHLECPMPPLVH